VSDDVPWLQTQVSGSTVSVGVNQSGLSNGVYLGTVTISAPGTSAVPPVLIQVRLIVADEWLSVYLPLVQRSLY
jgi:hypothetical protein